MPHPSPLHVDRGNCGIGFVADQSGRASHTLLELGLQALINLQHRGALAADAATGDGAGVLCQLPKNFFAKEAERLTKEPVNPDHLGVGVFFLPPQSVSQCQALAEAACVLNGLTVLAWRPVPVNPEAIGARARATMPSLWHALIAPKDGSAAPTASQLEQQFFLARKRFEQTARRSLGAYVASFSSRTIVYKGLLLAPQLAAFYQDLQDPTFETAIVVFHQRYSTNTLPTWQRAQPFRVLCHNGEINTLQGNVAWMQAREARLGADFAREATQLLPVIDTDGSDSAMLDNAAELLVRGGRDVRHALTMLVPPAWEKIPDVPQPVRDFYAYHAGLTEPWDGPAALVFTDGDIVGATLDRNGLRPCRYLITDDGLVAAASEIGAVPVSAARIQQMGKLGPGQMLAVNTATGRVLEDPEIKAYLAARQPYGDWLRNGLRHLKTVEAAHAARPPKSISLSQGGLQSALQRQAAFGYTNEELTLVLKPMAETGVEAIGSMGDDTPLAVFSEKPRALFSYFRQRFAEVTNPPIDPLREELVMSLRVLLGARGNFLRETAEQLALLELDSPFLTDEQLDALKTDEQLNAVTLSTLFRIAEGPSGLERALERLCAEAEVAARAGHQVLILSDRGVDARHSFIPSLLAVSAVHHYLLNQGLRTLIDLIVESGEPREVHHFAALIGYGAAAINPYLALYTAGDLTRRSQSPAQAQANYLHAAEHGLFKIMSKMGISTVDAYCGAQIFEVLGLAPDLVERYFTGTPAHLGGLNLVGLANIVIRWYELAFTPDGQPTLDSPGFYKFKREGELHAYNPAAVHALQAAVKTEGALNGQWPEAYEKYRKYSALQHQRPPVDVRDLLTLAPVPNPLALENVEARETIARRFSTAAMSLGALSPEAHETLSIAMNRLGGVSNSGEGGEDARRFAAEGNDAIKQVASGRFGVTPAYLVNAGELQIKMAQGSKPGEGGQLPGHKVTVEIAAIRHAVPGTTLISPPPHHDIYSIEDLAQLIYDLRQINPTARISVKLVAQAGVGTIAAGVAKAGADVILISGASGGTGASPLSSIKYAGIPWELGLAEAQQALVENGLRGRVRLRVDGGLRTGRDVVLAALLGADEFSFGTAALIAEGCLMARACHLNTCPAGVATQKPELRAKFDATPEQVVAFMLFIAEEVREHLAQLGLPNLSAAVGRVELLQPALVSLPPHTHLDVSALLRAPAGDGPRAYTGEANAVPSTGALNAQLLEDYEQAVTQQRPLQFSYPITNSDRTFGARLAGEIARFYGDAGVTETQTVSVTLVGQAGQAFGAFGLPGLHFLLYGAANDYVGKGLAGGRLVICHPQLQVENPVLAGNTCLYGATGGELYVAGRAGERFGVRNSGAVAVVEGVGDHGCEYMTGGLVVVLGSIGYNFGAGFTGGTAYLLNEPTTLGRLNPQLVKAYAPEHSDLNVLRAWLTQHSTLTGSPLARTLLHDWPTAAHRFIKVAPKDQPATHQPLPIPLALLSADVVAVGEMVR